LSVKYYKAAGRVNIPGSPEGKICLKVVGEPHELVEEMKKVRASRVRLSCSPNLNKTMSNDNKRGSFLHQ